MVPGLLSGGGSEYGRDLFDFRANRKEDEEGSRRRRRVETKQGVYVALRPTSRRRRDLRLKHTSQSED